MTDTLLAPDHRKRATVFAGAHHAIFAPVDAEQTTKSADLTDMKARSDTAAVQELGGYAFERMRFVETAPAASPRTRETDAPGEVAAAVIRDVQFPRISNPKTSASVRFNSLMERRPRFRRDTNEVVDYEIVYAGEDLISVRFDHGADTVGAAHPSGISSGITVLMHAGELLEAGDVFAVTSGWQDFISTRAAEEIGRQLHEYQFTPTAADVLETATDTRQWLITENALVLLFPSYSFGAPYVAGSAEVAIPWSDLAPYLNANAPAPIATLGRNLPR